ncbi:MAG: flagellar hook-basal body complex protein [Pseudomonadota bacterium]
MDNPGYVTLSRQSGLLQRMNAIANNIANLSTDGFRRESMVFAEVVDALTVEGGSLSQSAARVRRTDFSQGALRQTGGTFDLAIEGDGFFLVEDGDAPALTRAGSFSRNEVGELVTASGRRVLDIGQAPIQIAPEVASLSIGTDGTVSADGVPVAQLAVVSVEDNARMTRKETGLLTTDQPLIPAENAAVFQGFVEKSNVNPVLEMTDMIKVQRAYEMGQAFLEAEDERMRQFIRITGTPS